MPRALKSDKFFLLAPGRSKRSSGSRLIGVNHEYEGGTENITLADLIDFLEKNGIDSSLVPIQSDFIVAIKQQQHMAKWPPISEGTLVKTTQPNMALRKEWTKEAWEERKWGILGVVINHHDSHGLCYGVKHADGTLGYYDPSELEVV